MKRLALALALTLAACGAEPGRAPGPLPTAPEAQRSPAAPPPAPVGGSSDGTTCEEARDANVEEIGVGQKGPTDLTVAELGKALNHGRYLQECGVPAESQVAICAAIKGGVALGVTVSMRPPSEEQERCVAKAVRALPFPSHPKLDVVRTTF